jgi:hypothetical protein
MTPVMEAEPLDEEMAGNKEAALEPVPLQYAVLTQEQIKMVSDFMFTDPAWDELIRETLAQHGPSPSSLMSVQ